MKKVSKNKIITEESIIILVQGQGHADIYNDIEYDKNGNIKKNKWTLDRCLKYARKNLGYCGGVILVICESYLSGSIYRYGNTNDNEWWKVGIMEGFA